MRAPAKPKLVVVLALTMILSATQWMAFTARVHGSTAVRVTDQAASSTQSAIAYGQDGRCRLVWTDNRDANNEIYFAVVDSFGNRLSADVNVSNSPGASSTRPKIAVDAAGYSYVCWLEGSRVWIARLDPQGVFLTRHEVDLNFNHVVYWYPDIAVKADGTSAVSVGTRRGGTYEMYVVQHDANLVEICQSSSLHTTLTGLDPATSISWSGNNAVLVWQRIGDPIFEGSHLVSRTVGGSCSAVGGTSLLCGGDMHKNMTNHAAGVVFELQGNVYARGTCGNRLNESAGRAVRPTARGWDKGYCIAAWEDTRNGSASDIAYARYDSVSFSKSGSDTILTPGSSRSEAPSVASEPSGAAFISWQDDRDGNFEIYFARVPEPPGRGELAGTVYDAVTGFPIPFADVALVYPDHRVNPDRRGEFVASGNGKYRISGLIPGEYGLQASIPGYVSEWAAAIPVTAGGAVTVDLYVSTGKVVSGVVRDSGNGLPIPNADLRLVSQDGSFVRTRDSDSGGRYRFDVLPGIYKIVVGVPSAGPAADPYFSDENPFYSPDSVLALDATNGAVRDFPLRSNTVVMVHGFISDEKTWGTVDPPAQFLGASLRSALEQAGLHTESLKYDWRHSISSQGAEVSRWLGQRDFKSARVVAHSMGGLATRWYLEQLPESGPRRVPLLVTLGTPHHGTTLASGLIQLAEALLSKALIWLEVPAAEQVSEFAIESALQKYWPSTLDLRPNSENLNILNYDDASFQDPSSQWSCLLSEPSHTAEHLTAGTRYVTFAGEDPQYWGAVSHDLFLGPCLSDGVVPRHSARLYAAAVENLRTECLGPEADCAVRHGPEGPLETDWTLKNSPCVADGVIEVLRGLSPAQACPSLPVLQAAAAQTVLEDLANREHLMAPTDSVRDTVYVSPGSRLTVILSWRRGGARLRLHSPSGAVLDSSSSTGDPDLLFQSDYGQRTARFDVTTAEGGAWQVVTTVEADSGQLAWIRPFETGGVRLTARAIRTGSDVGAPVRLEGELTRGGAPLLGAQVQGLVGDGTGGTTSLSLVDDGTGLDLISGDGVYAASYLPQSTGVFTALLRASGGAGPTYEPREARTAFAPSSPRDLGLSMISDPPDSNWAFIGDPVIVRGRIENNAPTPADAVWMRGVDDSTGITFLDSVVSVPAEGSVEVASVFRSGIPGLHALRVTVALLGEGSESTLSNNIARRGIEVVTFGQVPQLVSAPRPPKPSATEPRSLWSRAYPSPATGDITIEFQLPAPVEEVQLTIFDAAGRVISKEAGGPWKVGTSRWVLNGRGSAGVVFRPGVFFYRLETGTGTSTGRIVIRN